MEIYRAIYTSRPVVYDVSKLSGILMHARLTNARDENTESRTA